MRLGGRIVLVYSIRIFVAASFSFGRGDREGCRGGRNKEVEIFSVVSRRVVWGSDTYNPICICICVRFSGRVHTELGEGQIWNVQRKRQSTKVRTYTHSKNLCVCGKEGTRE